MTRINVYVICLFVGVISFILAAIVLVYPTHTEGLDGGSLIIMSTALIAISIYCLLRKREGA